MSDDQTNEDKANPIGRNLIDSDTEIKLGPNDTAIVIRVVDGGVGDETSRYHMNAYIPNHRNRPQDEPLNAVEEVTLAMLLMGVDETPESQVLREHLRDYYMWRMSKAMGEIQAEEEGGQCKGCGGTHSPGEIDMLTEGLDITEEQKAMLKALFLGGDHNNS